MRIFVTILNVFGVWISLRTLQSTKNSPAIALHRQIGVTVLALFPLWLSLFLLPRQIFLHWTLAAAPFLISKLFKQAKKFFLQRKCMDIFCHFLDSLALEMRSGRSFRAAFANSLSVVPPRERINLNQMLEALRLNLMELPSSDLIQQGLYSDLRWVEQSPHNSLKRVLSLRYRLRVQVDLRRRSGQITAQVRAQMVILIVLYLALLLVVLNSGAGAKAMPAIVLSGMLEVVGLLSVYVIGRGFRWKI